MRRGVVPTFGGAIGYNEGGKKGAALGVAAGAAAMMPEGQMLLARLLKAGVPEQAARAMVASQHRSDSGLNDQSMEQFFNEAADEYRRPSWPVVNSWDEMA